MLLRESVNLKQVKEIIRRELRQERPYSIFLWGPPGVGKSEVVQQIHEEEKVPMVDIRLLNYDPTDLKGIPYFETSADGTKITRWSPPSFLKKEKMIIFLDEITTAPEVIQGIAYQISLDKRIGEHEINKSSLVIAASNRPEDETLVFIPPSALSNRFMHFEVKVDPNVWLQEYARKRGLSPYVTGFIAAYPDELFRMPKQGTSLSSPAFPTPRAWTRVAERIDVYHDDKELLKKFVYGNVGDESGARFISYYSVCSKIPDIDSILKGEKVTIPYDFAVMYFVVDILLRKAVSNNIKHIMRFLYGELYTREHGKEIIMYFFKSLISWKKDDRDFIKTIEVCFNLDPELRKYRDDYKKYLIE